MKKRLLLCKSIRENIGEITGKWLILAERDVNINDHDRPVDKLELIDSIPAFIGAISEIVAGRSDDTVFRKDGVFYDLALDFGKRRFQLGFDIDDAIFQCNAISRIMSEMIETAGLSRTEELRSREIVNQVVDLIQQASLKGYIQEYRVEMSERAIKDKLTGFYNETSVVKMIDSEIYRSKRYRRPFSIAFLSVDGFSEIVEKNGVMHGNKIVKAVALDVIKLIRASDIAARLQSDVFAVVMPETASAEAKSAVDRIRRSVKQESLRKNELVTLSGGIVEVPTGGESFSELLKKGNEALRIAVKDGGNITKVTA